MEFKIREVTHLKYGIQIETATRAVELEMTYEQMREIQETIEPFNPPAAALFPVYSLRVPLFLFNITPTLDLERFQKWCGKIFSPPNYSQYPQEIKEYLSRAFGVDMGSLVLEASEGGDQKEQGDKKEQEGESKPQKILLKVAKEIGTDVVIPALLGIAEQIPVIDRVSRLLTMCGGALQELSDQDSLVQDLRTEISKVKEALQIYEEVFGEEEMSRTLPLSELEKTLKKALGTLTNLTHRGGVLGVVLAKNDNNKLKKWTSSLNESLKLFYQSVPLSQQLLAERQKMKKLLGYPEVFHSTIRDHLSRFQAGSRQWMFEEASAWLDSSFGGGDGAETKTNNLGASPREEHRVFWIQAGPGMGKSAFAATLSKKWKGDHRLLGAYFCRYTKADESPSAIIRSLSAQCYENLSSSAPSSTSVSVSASTNAKKKIFEKAFVKWDELEEKPSSSDLFDMLLATPLQEYSDLMSSRYQVPHSHPPMVFLIDALDEVSVRERQPLLHMLSSKVQSLPSWVKIVITSRPEADIVHSLSVLNPFEIKEDDPRHLQDIRLFLSCHLRAAMEEEELEAGVDLFVARSEGKFIYVSTVIAEILKNQRSRWSLSDLGDRLPEGLVGWYRELFVRMRARDERYFDEVIFPVVRLIIGAKEPLSLGDVKMILNLHFDEPQELQEQRLVDELHQLFPLRSGDVFVPFHKSVADWLTDAAVSGPYLPGQARDNFFISKERANQAFVDHFRSLFVSAWLDEGTLSRRPSSGSYFYRHAFDHFLDSRSEEVVVFGLSQLFRLRVLASLLEEIGVHELVRLLERYLASFSSRFQDKRHDISELKLLLQLVRLSSPGLRSRDVDALPFQLLARLTPSQLEAPYLRLKQLHQECDGWRSVSERGFWLKPSKNYLTAAGGPLERIIRLRESPACVLDLPDGQLLTAAGNQLLILNSDDEIVMELVGHTEDVTSVCALSDGRRVVSGSADKTVRVWDVDTGSCERVLEGHGRTVTCVCALSDGRRVVSGSLDKTVRVWDVNTGSCERVLEGHGRTVTSVCALPDGRRVVSGSYDKTVRVCDVDTGSCEQVLEGHGSMVRSVCALPDGRRVVSGSDDETVRVWDVDTGSCERVLEGHGTGVTSVDALPDGRRVVSGSYDKTVRVWDVETGSCERVLEGHGRWVTSVCALPDGRGVVSGSWDNTVRVWDVDTGSCERVLEGHEWGVRSVCVLPDGRRVVSGSYDKTVRVWDVETGSCERVLEGHEWRVESVCVLPDGRRVVSGSDDETVRVWDVDTGSCERVLEGHGDTVTSVCALPDGRRVVSGSLDKTVRVWDVDTGSCERVLEGHDMGSVIRSLGSEDGILSAPATPLLQFPYLDGFVHSPDLFLDLPSCQVITMESQTLILHKIGAGIPPLPLPPPPAPSSPPPRPPSQPV